MRNDLPYHLLGIIWQYLPGVRSLGQVDTRFCQYRSQSQAAFVLLEYDLLMMLQDFVISDGHESSLSWVLNILCGSLNAPESNLTSTETIFCGTRRLISTSSTQTHVERAIAPSIVSTNICTSSASFLAQSSSNSKLCACIFSASSIAPCQSVLSYFSTSSRTILR